MEAYIKERELNDKLAKRCFKAEYERDMYKDLLKTRNEDTSYIMYKGDIYVINYRELHSEAGRIDTLDVSCFKKYIEKEK